MDNSELKNKIENFTDEELVVEGMVNISNYLPEQQQLFKDEIAKRDLSLDAIEKIVRGQDSLAGDDYTEEAAGKSNKGVLLVVVAALLIGIFFIFF